MVRGEASPNQNLQGRVKTMKRMIVLLALCSTGLLFAADAQPVAPAKDRPMLNDWLKNPEKIKKYDKNGDGKIDADERKAAREDYRKEFTVVVRPAAVPAAIQKSPGQGFDLWMAMPENIKKSDQNGDGKIDSGERKAARQAWLQEQAGAGGEKK